MALYSACVGELASLLQSCPGAYPSLEDPHAPFSTPTQRRILSLVRFWEV